MEASPQLLQIFGLPPGSELPTFEQQPGVLYPRQDWERLRDAVASAIDKGVPYAVDLRAWRGDQPIWVTARATPVMEQGRVIKLRGNVQDITDRKQIEEALRAADARKDEFLATLAHELRNPLAPIRNALAILRQRDSTSAAGVRARELMERQLAHLVRLVDDLLDVSRISLGKIEMKRAFASLQAIVEHALETVMPLMEACGHRLEVNLGDAASVTLHVDPTRIAQVLGNLLGNAAKYTPRGGFVRLTAGLTHHGSLQIAVRDNGIGIPREMLERVFDLFTQVGTSLQRSQGGLGIGLSLAKQMVALHGGSVVAESDGEHGSNFVVELPPDCIALPPVEVLHPPPTQALRRRVLLVDDNVDAAESLSALLQLEGHDVEMVHRGLDALAAAARLTPDVVLLDIGLPDITGYEVASRMRQRDSLSQTLIVAVTGWGSERDRQRATEAGIDAHLTKPVTLQELSSALSGSTRSSVGLRE